MEKFSWRKRGKSFVYAFAGIKYLIGKEHNAWIHCAATVMVIAAGAILGIDKNEWCLVILCIGMVLAAEGFNTAIEKLTDLASPGYNELAGKAKDVAAGAVLITAIAAATVGLIIFIPKILQIIQGI